MILLKNGLILENNLSEKSEKLVKRDILINGSKIEKIAEQIENNGYEVKDVDGMWVIPAGVDVHAHLRDPGFEYKETIKSGTMSAAKGGIGTIISMPNLKPVPDSIEHLAVQNEIIKRDAVIRVFPSASVSVDEKGEKVSDIENLNDLVACFTDDGLCVNNLDVLATAMDKTKKIIASHAQAAGAKTDEEAEFTAVKREIELLKKHPCAYHFCHLSTKESFEYVKKAQEEGLDVTCEVMPHHLFLNKSQIKDANWKMNPPLRSEENRLATIDALLNGVATMIATDHAPHSPEEKAKEYAKAPNGIIGFETMFPLVYTYLVKTGKITHKRMLELTVFNPAKRFSLPCGEISEGKTCDIAVLDVNHEHTYCESEILSKSRNTPFIGFKLFGFNALTIIDGKIVYERGQN